MGRSSFLRASDDDREQAVDQLHAAMLEGRIGPDELEDRVGRAYHARTYGELDPVLADLPAPPEPARRERSSRWPAWSRPAVGIVSLVSLLALVSGGPEYGHQFQRGVGTAGQAAGGAIHTHPSLLPVLAAPVIGIAFMLVLCATVGWLVSLASPTADV